MSFNRGIWATDVTYSNSKPILHKYLKEEGLRLAPDKSKIITKDKELAGMIEEALKDLGYTREEELKLLGVDWTSNEAIEYATAKKRIDKAGEKEDSSG